ncbi:unnamed protein product [Kuraishia capsulata CBS 1993]|uniref:RNA helicase n=1 Tax=Kuraishia capsulata CBS 1993 TaxID=1382522 RepID=W6MI42_9ASCO|nr:uncharacterized protein KUCA_T00001493001 [Kuraishia capsulata CBS 1993]CDK25523.1 unnamed protein product [Kuraishia capsulata CBS 1993]
MSSKAISQICNVVARITGMEPADEDVLAMANFIQALHESSNNKTEFLSKLEETGANELANLTFVDEIDKILNPELLTVKKEETESPVKIKTETLEFSGLALANTEAVAIKEENDFIKNFKVEESKDFIKTERKPKVVRERPIKREKIEDRADWDDEPLNGKVYPGEVLGIKDYGVFVRLFGIKSRDRTGAPNKTEGLCHVSCMAKHRVSHPSDLVKMGQEVYVKVTGISSDKKISLSMKDINQISGEEEQAERFGTGSNNMALGGRGRSPTRASSSLSKKHKRSTSESPDLWELAQSSKAFGVKRQAVDLDEMQAELLYQPPMLDEEEDEEIEIEITNEEPPFLRGQTSRSGIELPPVKIVKNPEGSLNRSAMRGSTLMKEVKEKKYELAKEEQRKLREEKKTDTAEDPFNQQQVYSRTDMERRAYMGQSSRFEQWQKENKSASLGKRTDLSIAQQRETLPVYSMRSKLVEGVRNNKFLVIVGETGSGKTTQITQYLAEEGLADKGLIGCTQPRRVAAVSVAKRVSEEVGCRVGDEVGYTIRFEDVTSAKTKIKYMTDGMLLREAINDPYMRRYSVIMLDEAHERTIATDVLFALLKVAAQKRDDLKVIVTSATLDANKFSTFFDSCPIMQIPGRTFPVEIYYSAEPEMDYVAACLDSIISIHLEQPAGDILVFLTGKEEIDTCCETLLERMQVFYDQGDTPELLVLPIYSSLPSEMQTKIFEPTPAGKRKVILATNIAETSLTIDGIYYVVDPGFVKINAYDPKLGMDSLIVSPISKAQANQRAGRAGRTGPGKCYRLYTKSAYEKEMNPNTIPEIQRQNLSHTILMLKAMGINDLLNFDFMDPPPVNSMVTALEELYTLTALDADGYLTQLGRKMADFPMEPALAKTLIASFDFGCSEEVLSIVAMLSVPDVFYSPKDKRELADRMKAKFNDPTGDHITLLNVYERWIDNNQSKIWCQEHFIHDKSLRRAKEVRGQLLKIMSKHKHSLSSCGGNIDLVRKTFCSGFFKNSAKKSSEESLFKTIIENTPVHIHPSSALFKKTHAEYVMFHTLVLTAKEYMRYVTKIEPKWLVELAPTFFQVANPQELSARKKAIKIQPLFNKFDEQQTWRISKRRG